MSDKPTIQGQTQAEKTVRKADCAQCHGPRNCDIRGCYWKGDGDEDGHEWGTTWFILECRGCEHVFVQTVSEHSDIGDYDDGPDGKWIFYPDEKLTYWPALSARLRPEWMNRHDNYVEGFEKLRIAMHELYGALDNDLNMLAAIGIRTCLDIASALLGIDPELSFKAKLDTLVEDNPITSQDRLTLETLIDAGSASAHRGWMPDASTLRTLVEALERFVHDAFVQPHTRKRLDQELDTVKGIIPPKRAKK